MNVTPWHDMQETNMGRNSSNGMFSSTFTSSVFRVERVTQFRFTATDQGLVYVKHTLDSPKVWIRI